MKYMVMECHPAYAVLMDEASRIVHAANLHYEVGQIVESPVLLEHTAARPVISRNVRRFIAAAACFALMAGAGALYYRTNYMVYSSIVVSAAADMRMEVSRSGRVLSVQPLNQDAANLLADYDCKGKDQLTVTNELIERATQNGYVQKGDTVHVYYNKDKNKDPENYQNNVAQAIESHELTADVHSDYDAALLTPPQTQTTARTETSPQTTAIPEPTQPRGNAVIDQEPHPEHHPEPVERPAQDAPVAPDDPKPAPGAEPTAPRIADPAKEHKTPETPADNKPADNKPADNKHADNKPADNKPADNKPADNNPADNKPADNKPADNKPSGNKPAEPAKEPAAPAEQKPATQPAPAQKEERTAKDPAPAEPQKPEPAAPGNNGKTPEKPDMGRNEERPQDNAHEQFPHEEHVQPHDAGAAIAPQAPAPAAGASDMQAPEPPAAPAAPEPPVVSD